MIKEFKLPELGENIANAEIVKINISVGDKVENNQILFEIETDKATIEVPSDFSGVVKEIKIKEGEKAEIGQTALIIDEAGESSDKIVAEENSVKKAEGKVTETKPKIEEESAPTVAGTIEVKMPELGENIESASVSKVLIKVGDKINKDDILVEVETDKATIEVPSEVGGVVKEVRIKDGETAKVGATIILVEGKIKSEPKIEVPQPTKPAKAEQPKKVEEKSHFIQNPVNDSKEKPELSREELSKRIIPASPSVRRFAREIGIDIINVRGTGPGGRISVEDVKLFSKNLNQTRNQSGTASGTSLVGVKAEILPDFTKFGEVEVQPMNNIRKKTAEHLSYAWQTIPHVTQFDKADITELENLRKSFGKQVEKSGGKLTVTAILLKVLSAAMKVYPQFNSSIDFNKKEIIYKKYFNIGIAVDTPKGLVVPVIRDVDKKNITQLSVELSEISVKARDGKLSLEDMQGGNFTISNLGGIGGTAFTPIVNSPEVAILGVSRGSFEPVYKDGNFVPRLMLPLSLSYDHRIIDGADAARFIRWVSLSLENPFLLSLEG